MELHLVLAMVVLACPLAYQARRFSMPVVALVAAMILQHKRQVEMAAVEMAAMEHLLTPQPEQQILAVAVAAVALESQAIPAALVDLALL